MELTEDVGDTDIDSESVSEKVRSPVADAVRDCVFAPMEADSVGECRVSVTDSDPLRLGAETLSDSDLTDGVRNTVCESPS